METASLTNVLNEQFCRDMMKVNTKKTNLITSWMNSWKTVSTENLCSSSTVTGYRERYFKGRTRVWVRHSNVRGWTWGHRATPTPPPRPCSSVCWIYGQLLRVKGSEENFRSGTLGCNCNAATSKTSQFKAKQLLRFEMRSCLFETMLIKSLAQSTLLTVTNMSPSLRIRHP